ncbi:MAG: SIS domain-containing protein [Chloroflexota bacterium]|nr:MAG: SIS domain-containing protein [Chloroflexota bacterium]
MNPLALYFQDQQALLSQLDTTTLGTILEILERARTERHHIFVFGNGGSASTASHFAADLGKNTVRSHMPRFQVTCLNDNMAIFSAYANDDGYDSVFAEPLISLSNSGDVAIAISASGNSPNVVRAIQAANERGLVTIGLAGMSGGKLAQLARHSIVVPSQSYEHVEDAHLMLCHALVATIKQNHPELNKGEA